MRLLAKAYNNLSSFNGLVGSRVLLESFGILFSFSLKIFISFKYEGMKGGTKLNRKALLRWNNDLHTMVLNLGGICSNIVYSNRTDL